MDQRLIGAAYRMLGSLADAQDAVQEAHARWYALPADERAVVEQPGAWLMTVTSRVCLDMLGSAQRRRERYVGTWLPEPLPESDPADRVTLDESVGMALLVVLETMTPAERVAFVLHDVFGYRFDEIAAIVGRSSAACRQLASSARRRTQSARGQTQRERHRDVVDALKEAWARRDIEALVTLFDPDATAITDGGGRVSAAVRPVVGPQRIAALLLGVSRRQPDVTPELTTVNGQPGLVVRAGADVMAVISFDIGRNGIRHLWAVRNPDKLEAWS